MESNSHSTQHEPNTTAKYKGMKRINQFGEEVFEEKFMAVEEWEQRWAAGQTLFTMPQVHPMLKKHYELLTNGKRNLRFFLPLCGKTLDLKWLAEQGHEVVGNEVVELGCKQFFEEQNIPYTVSPVGKLPGSILKSTADGLHITLYCCDFFQLTPDIISTFDAIWDRGSFAAINLEERSPYPSVIAGLCKPSTVYLLDTFRVDNSTFAGPPHDFPEEIFPQYFGPYFSVSHVEENDALTPWQKEVWRIDAFTEHVHLLKLL